MAADCFGQSAGSPTNRRNLQQNKSIGAWLNASFRCFYFCNLNFVFPKRSPAFGEGSVVGANKHGQCHHAERGGDVLAGGVITNVLVACGNQTGKGSDTAVPGDDIGLPEIFVGKFGLVRLSSRP